MLRFIATFFSLLTFTTGMAQHHHSHSQNHSHSHQTDNHHNDNESTRRSMVNMLHDDNGFTLTVEPLILITGEFALSFLPVFEGELQELVITVTAPDASSQNITSHNITGETSSGNYLSFPEVLLGLYQFEITYGDTLLQSSVWLTQDTVDNITITSIFVPAPSMANRGQSEVFVYAAQNSENVHGDMTISYVMEGMQHSTDHTQFSLEHVHLDDTYMTNRASLTFPMLGEWQTRVRVNDSTVQFTLNVMEDSMMAPMSHDHMQHDSTTEDHHTSM